MNPTRTICRCGRIDKHAAHAWTRPYIGPQLPAISYWCGGAPIIEGSLAVAINEDDALGDLT